MTTVTITTSGLKTLMGGVHTARARGFDLDVPATLTDDARATALRDLELLTAALKSNPSAVSDVLRAGAAGDFETARKLATEHGLTEEAFVEKGGGLLLAIGIGLAILLYSQAAY